jgi:uncharacterized protein YdeI (YjbR/CyaY-like superfamily)
MEATFFKDQADFRKWLEKNHIKEKELVVGFYKKESGKLNMTWSESVDQALCFGWIDGIRRSVDKDSYSIRFTPRNKTSAWSRININKVEELIKQGLMKPAGLEIYKHRKEERSGIYSYESEPKTLHKDLKDRFKANKSAWEYFIKQTPYYQKMTIRWILSGKQLATRERRLDKVIAESEKNKRVF